MATWLDDGSIQLKDGRTVFANNLIQGQDLLEILELVVPLYVPSPAWPFVSGGGGGASGGNGIVGRDGAAGPQGPQGTNPGPPGSQGSQGSQGNQGAIGTGSQGFQGNQGRQGSQGNQGNQGATGSGSQGSQGAQGIQGPQGRQGNQGNQGFQGNQGAIGTGTQGSQGPQGNQGNQGNQGAAGGSSQIVTQGNYTPPNTAFAVITGLTFTPAAGTYMVWFSTYMTSDTNSKKGEFKIVSGGVDAPESLKSATTTTAGDFVPGGSIARVTVDGTQAIQAQAREVDAGGTCTFLNSQLMIALTS